jgi:predicted DsbA family dithiol-disulfide isomerase
MATVDKIKVEIWSDVMCPFCYIGKRQFEAALDGFEGKERVEVVWRSYQLDPSLKAEPGQTLYQYLAKRKGMTLERSTQMHDQVTQSAATVGLEYRFDKVVVNNSHAAHRLVQLAKTQGVGDAVKEGLFRAYFTEGRDIGDRAVLAQLAVAAGLSAEGAAEAFDDPSGEWGRRVDDEAAEAHALGSTGVPFFVFQRQYAVTGAQGESTFRKVLEKVSRENP